MNTSEARKRLAREAFVAGASAYLRETPAIDMIHGAVHKSATVEEQFETWWRLQRSRGRR